jgi:hypothetical protein
VWQLRLLEKSTIRLFFAGVISRNLPTFKHYEDQQLALFLANKIERELAIDQTFTPT